jgi:hypothetical protein
VLGEGSCLTSDTRPKSSMWSATFGWSGDRQTGPEKLIRIHHTAPRDFTDERRGYIRLVSHKKAVTPLSRPPTRGDERCVSSWLYSGRLQRKIAATRHPQQRSPPDHQIERHGRGCVAAKIEGELRTVIALAAHAMASERRRSRLLPDEHAPSASPVPAGRPRPTSVTPTAGIAAANSPPRRSGPR